jgi:ankyrin repeat protein
MACHDDTELVKILLDHGANVNAKTATDLTPLHRACQGEKDRRLTVYLLIENGADLNAVDQQGCAPIHDAAQFPQNGALAILAEIPAVNVHAVDKCGRTPYQIALANPHTNAAGILKRRMVRDMAEAQSSRKDPRVTV